MRLSPLRQPLFLITQAGKSIVSVFWSELFPSQKHAIFKLTWSGKKGSNLLD